MTTTTQDPTHGHFTPERLAELRTTMLETGRALAGVHQRVAHDLGELAASAAREGLRTTTELGAAAVDAIRSLQAGLTPPPAAGDGAQDRDRSHDTGVADPLGAVRFAEASAHAMIAGAERLLASTERAGRGIQEALSTYMTRMDELYRRA